MAACLFTNQKDWSIDIPLVEECDGVTIYKIKVRVGVVNWEVKHRYKEFAQMHIKLVNEYGISKDILPPKKIINNKDPTFVEKRRSDLETYLTNILSLLLSNLPEPLAYFLDFHKYDVIILLQKLSNDIVTFNFKQKIQDHFEFNVLQIHAICERLKLPCPPSNMRGFQHDFSIILDFCTNLQGITIRGGRFIHESSNIIKSKINFELSTFKSLKKLILTNIDPTNLVRAEELRNQLEILIVVCCELKHICDILLCDTLHKNIKSVNVKNYWTTLLEADFSHNALEVVDDTLGLLPNLEKLNLSSNRIQNMPPISGFNNLLRLNLSSNNIYKIHDLNLNFSKLIYIDLSQNHITSLKGLDELVNLQGFNIASNNINDINELIYLIHLTKLEYIVLTGNPLSTIVDYRIKVLERFAERASKICLDNEQTTQQELDTVAVLRAIRFVKEGKTPKTSTFLTYSN